MSSWLVKILGLAVLDAVDGVRLVNKLDDIHLYRDCRSHSATI
jgi:hypothetical protein